VERELVRQRGVEREFDCDPLPWGKWVIPGKVIEYKGEYYLRLITTPKSRGTIKTVYLDESGKKLNWVDIAHFLPGDRDSRKQSNFGLESPFKHTDDTNFQVHCMAYKFSSLKKIRIGGRTYSLK
jgi:hypothetical protein